MRNLFLLVFSIFIVLNITSFKTEDKWEYLIDKNLSQWQIYQSFHHQLGYKGMAPKDQQGNLIKPLGYNINEGNEFSVINLDGEPVLHIDGEIYGCLFTKKIFGNYDLKLKVKWGTKKYTPRINEDKDSGVLYHSQGPCGVDYWRTWMLSQEFQVTEKGMGDYWSQSTSLCDVNARKEGSNYFFDKNAPLLTFGSGMASGNFCHAGIDAEIKDGWNDLELITYGDKSIRIVNGLVVMALSNSRYVDSSGTVKPLVKGKIQIQSEAAEVFYKEIKIKPVDKLPAAYAEYFKH
jgi:hypothetical protein